MKIQMGVTQKMRLYNVYRLCKKYSRYIERLEVSEKIETDSINKISICSISNWIEVKNILKIINRIPSLKKYASECINLIPESLRDKDSFQIDNKIFLDFMNKSRKLCDKMESIIELYEGLNIENVGDGIDIKLPPCDDLKDYISYLKEIDFIFSQCPFLQCENELLKFGSVDVGSNWIKLTVAAASTCFILTNTASLLDKALLLRSHFLTVQQQEETLKSQQMKNELAEENIKTFDALRASYTDIVIKQLVKETGKTLDPEELDKAERSLEKIILLLDKGCEIYATLDAPEEVQALFPEIQGNLELPDSIIKYLEDKEEKQD